MNENKHENFTHHTFQLDLGAGPSEEPVQIEASAWRGVDHIGIRQLFRGQKTNLLYWGKSGFNIPVDAFERTIIGLIECYNGATGSTLSLHAGEEDREEFLSDLHEEIVGIVEEGPQETVYKWSQS
jgi:hypothetical protein